MIVVASRERIKEDVIKYLIEHNGDPNINEEDDVDRYNMDDLDLVELQIHLERMYGKQLPETESIYVLSNPNQTVKELIDNLYQQFNS